MPFTKELPKWDNVGTKPPDAKIAEGYLFNDHPPANWWNYQMNRTYLALKELQDNAADKTLASPTVNGLMTAADKAKLNGIAANANNYTHPTNHPPSIITQDSNNRFVTDTEKSNWNAKETTTGAQAKANAVQTNLTNHENDGVKHIVAGERTAWNSAIKGGGQKFQSGGATINFNNDTSAMVTVTFPEAFANASYIPWATPITLLGAATACVIYRIVRNGASMDIYAATNNTNAVTGSLSVIWGAIGS